MHSPGGHRTPVLKDFRPSFLLGEHSSRMPTSGFRGGEQPVPEKPEPVPHQEGGRDSFCPRAVRIQHMGSLPASSPLAPSSHPSYLPAHTLGSPVPALLPSRSHPPNTPRPNCNSRARLCASSWALWEGQPGSKEISRGKDVNVAYSAPTCTCSRPPAPLLASLLIRKVRDRWFSLLSLLWD